MPRLKVFCVALAGMLFAGQGAACAANLTKSCDLFSQAAASALFGAPLDPARDMVASCAYFGAGEDDKKGLIVMVFTTATLGSALNVATAYKTMVHGDPASHIEPVGGLGDQANFITSSDNTVTLEVLYHDTIVGIGASNSPKPGIKAALLAAMRQALGRF